MGHLQPPIPIQMDNSTALGVVTNNFLPRQTKAMDMRFWWLWGRDAQEQFQYYWHPGTTNLGDYWTKHQCSARHQGKQSEILTPLFIIQALHAFTNRCPATSGKGIMLPTQIAAAAA